MAEKLDKQTLKYFVGGGGTILLVLVWVILAGSVADTSGTQNRTGSSEREPTLIEEVAEEVVDSDLNSGEDTRKAGQKYAQRCWDSITQLYGGVPPDVNDQIARRCPCSRLSSRPNAYQGCVDTFRIKNNVIANSQRAKDMHAKKKKKPKFKRIPGTPIPVPVPR